MTALTKPTTFEEALDDYLIIVGWKGMVDPAIVHRWYEERFAEGNGQGFTITREDKEAALNVMLAFALKERQR